MVALIMYPGNYVTLYPAVSMACLSVTRKKLRIHMLHYKAGCHVLVLDLGTGVGGWWLSKFNRNPSIS
jgi:hypothetical protein